MGGRAVGIGMSALLLLSLLSVLSAMMNNDDGDEDNALFSMATYTME
jgi:hypothetical protein